MSHPVPTRTYADDELDEKAREVFREHGRNAWKAKVKKYGMKGAKELNAKAGKISTDLRKLNKGVVK